MLRAATVILALTVTVLPLIGCGAGEGLSERSFRTFADELEGRLAILSRDAALANYQASISGHEEDYARSAAAQLAVKTALSDTQTFARLEAWREAGTVTDPILARRLALLRHAFLANQLPAATLAELVERQSAIEKRFNTHRATLDGRSVSDNEVAAILRDSTDSAELERAWLASKEIGREVATDIVELVKLRNRAAHDLGFVNFQAMQLALSEQDPAQIEALFDELDQLTRDEFARAKAEIDTYLAARVGLAADQLQPWHYQNPFFQEAPTIYPVDLDRYYADRDPVQLASDFYAGIGLDVADVIARSDLYGRAGKYQHAFCEDVDRRGDVRVLASIEPNSYWMNTLLHELGHAVYAKYNDPDAPWVLRDAAHAFTTEAIANMFGRLASDPDWLHEAVGISAEERDRIAAAAHATLRLEQLVFSRWAQVMFRFEKGMYENPEQDLNELWWTLVERYQLLRRPEGRAEPDWAAKIHIALYPAYYHNYLMGELLASQLENHLRTVVLGGDAAVAGGFAGRPEVGAYLREQVFKPGRTLPWNEMITRATGEPLTAAHYARQFVGSM